MEPLVLLITTAGLARFTSAQGGDDIDLTIASVGVTDTAFAVAPTLTALPGELKRLVAVSGTVVDDTTVHMTVRDDSPDAYGVRGFGLFLADGTLFAVYGRPDRVVEKSGVSTTLLALDIAFPAGKIDMIRFGDTNFLYPPATETVRGVARIATDAVADAGTDTASFITPRQLGRRILAAFTGRRVATAGLATGGGDLSADRTITVVKASPADAEAGQLDDRAVTPFGLVNLIGRIARMEGRNIFTSGLATGGGGLGADRTIAVARATGAEVDAATIDDKAVTPFGIAGLIGRVRTLVEAVTDIPQQLGPRGHLRIPFTPVILQWGSDPIVATGGSVASAPIAFPRAFPAEAWIIVGNADGRPAQTWHAVTIVFESVTLTGATAVADTAKTDVAIQSGRSVRWFAIGR